MRQEKSTQKEIIQPIEEQAFSTPLTDAPVDEKVYGLGNSTIQKNQDGSIDAIPEQEYKRPELVINMEDEAETPLETEVPKEKPIFNPAMQDLSNKDKEKGSELLVDACINLYAFLYQQGYNLLELSDDKLKRKALKGQFHLEILQLHLPLPDSDETISVAEFIHSYNDQVGKALTVDQAFIERVRPVLLDMFIQKGWGLTNEQYILYEIIGKTAKDIGVVIRARLVLNEMLSNANKFFEEMILANKPQQKQPNKQQQQKQATSEAFEPKQQPITPIVEKGEGKKKKNKMAKKVEVETIDHNSEQFESEIIDG